MLLRLLVEILFISQIALTTNQVNSLDDNNSTQNEEKDPILSQCLQQGNNAEAIWLPETGVMQDLGVDQIPDHVQTQVHEAICDMNAYFRKSIQSTNACRLAEPHCRNQQPLCAFWALQGRCTDPNYRTFMNRNCPVACRLCDTELFRAFAWLELLDDLELVYQKKEDEPDVDVVERRQRVLTVVFDRFGMSQNRSGNFAEELLQRTNAVIPSFLAKVYSDEALTDQEVDWLRQSHGFDPNTPAHEVEMSVFVQYRGRGYFAGAMAAADHLVVRPLQLSIAFAIPNEEALHTIRDLNMSILEMGAGTGYWTSQLLALGVSVAAYDVSRGSDNAFFQCLVHGSNSRRVCDSILDQHPEWAKTHALLMIWPNDPDSVDQPQFCGDSCSDSEPVWDIACLRAYLKHGGTTVIYVGERQRVLQKLYNTNEGGTSSTLEFQRLLESSFDLQTTVSIPQFWLNADDMSVWTRKLSLGKDDEF